MQRTLLILLVLAYLIVNVQAQCRLSDKKLQKETRRFEKKCLEKGNVFCFYHASFYRIFVQR